MIGIQPSRASFPWARLNGVCRGPTRTGWPSSRQPQLVAGRDAAAVLVVAQADDVPVIDEIVERLVGTGRAGESRQEDKARP